MKLPLLDRFQGALVGAAIADLMALNIIPASSRIGDSWCSPANFPVSFQNIPDGAAGKHSPGRFMMDVACHLLPPDLIPPELRGRGGGEFDAAKSSASGGNVQTAQPLAGAIAHIPLRLLFYGDGLQEDSDVIPCDHFRLIQPEVASFASAFPTISITQDSDTHTHGAAWATDITLTHILSETFCPKTHIPTLIKLLQSKANPSPMKDVLHLVHQALLEGRGRSNLPVPCSRSLVVMLILLLTLISRRPLLIKRKHFALAIKYLKKV